MEETGMDTREEHLLKQQPEVVNMDTASNHMMEDTTLEVKQVERGHEDMVMAKHQNGDGAEHRQIHRDLGSSGSGRYRGGCRIFAFGDSSSPWCRRVERRIEMS
jgi:hypothetical protein